MLQKVKSILQLYCILIAMDLCSSATLYSLEIHRRQANLYCNIKANGIHTPHILNMDTQRKNIICNQILRSEFMQDVGICNIDLQNLNHRALLRSSVQLFPLKRYFTNGNPSHQPTCPISVRQISVNNFRENMTPFSFTFSDLMMECLAVREDIELQQSHLTYILVSYAYCSQSFYITGDFEWGTRLIAYGNLSPFYFELDQIEVEDLFLYTRSPLEKLREKNPNIALLMDEKGPLSLYFKVPKMKLCMSIFDIDFYKEQNIKYRPISSTYSQIDYVTVMTEFETQGIRPISTQNIVCPGKENGKPILLYLTHSYQDDNSLFAQRKRENGRIMVDVYVKDISALADLVNYSSSGPFYFELM